MTNTNLPSDTSSMPEQREIARGILQRVLEICEPDADGASRSVVDLELGEGPRTNARDPRL